MHLQEFNCSMAAEINAEYVKIVGQTSILLCLPHNYSCEEKCGFIYTTQATF